jgi:hypothetical protein
MGNRRDACRALMGRPEGKRKLTRPRRRWEGNIKMDLQEFGWGAWTGLIWLGIAISGSCECGNEASVSVKCEGFLR